MGYYNSFILRVWSDDHGAVRGTIEHVGSRDSMAFADPQRVVAFLLAHLGAPNDHVVLPFERPGDDQLGPVDHDR